MNYLDLLGKSYKAYQYAWCKQRGYDVQNVDADEGFGGECYVGIREFENNEFQDEKYMSELLDRTMLAYWQYREKLKALWVEQKLCEESILQRINGRHACPRCGSEMECDLAHNSFSRRADIYVCSTCGMLEAIEDARKAGDPSYEKLTVAQWVLIQNETENAGHVDYDIRDMIRVIEARIAYREYIERCTDEA